MNISKNEEENFREVVSTLFEKCECELDTSKLEGILINIIKKESQNKDIELKAEYSFSQMLLNTMMD